MSDALNSETSSFSSAPVPKPLVDDTLDDELPRPQREGLPRGYRMRADQHYVEQLNAPFVGQPVRMLAADEIEGGNLEQKGIRPLVESIRKLGIVHPLIVRRAGARYSVIAGRKRLAAAHTLRLATVPCLVHEADDAQAAMLAAADALVIGAPGNTAEPSALILRTREAAAAHLAKVRECLELAAEDDGWMARSVAALVRAHHWRAACLLDMLELLADKASRAGDQALRNIVRDVVDGFRPERTLRNVAIGFTVSGDSRMADLSDRQVAALVAAGIFAMMPLVERAKNAGLSVQVDGSRTDSMVIEVVQSAVPISRLLAGHFFDEEAAAIRPGDEMAAIGALAVRSFVEKSGGRASMELPDDGGSRLRIALTHS